MRIVKIHSLPPITELWVDQDTIMFHACFQLLVNWVEKEGGLTHANYKTHKHSIDEAKSLYDWWLSVNDQPFKYDHEKIADKNLNRLIKIRKFLWT